MLPNYYKVIGSAMNDVNLILDFWFGADQASLDPDYWQQKSALWFGFDPDTDLDISKKFKPLLLKAKNNELCSWENTPSGRLALIILTDQFPRNIFRGTSDAFAYDSFALEQCLKELKNKQYKGLHPVQQMFLFMPLEHSERIEDQNTCVELLDNLVSTSTADMSKTMVNFRDFAVKHRDIIAEFGRFPHRNDILNRESNEQERLYLKSGGTSFGQG